MTMQMQFEQINFFQKFDSNCQMQQIQLFDSNPEQSINLQGQQFIDCVLGINFDRNLENSSSVSEILSQQNQSEVKSLQTSVQQNPLKELKKSSNHNCQKQTVSALKSLIRIQDFNNYSENEKEVLECLWRNFKALKSRNVGKVAFLSCFFNVDKTRINQLKSYGFQELFARFSNQQIEIAQQNLRIITIESLTEKNINKYIDQSSITRKQNFYHYLMGFKESLIEKSLKKRMTKKIAVSKAKTLEIYDCLN